MTIEGPRPPHWVDTVDTPGVTNEDVQKTHPGFNITCQACNGSRVIVENSLGFSETSGQWGSVDLVCLDCKANTAIYGDLF